MTVETKRRTWLYDLFKALVTLALIIIVVSLALEVQNAPQAGEPLSEGESEELAVSEPDAEATASEPDAEATVSEPDAEATASEPDAEATVSEPDAEATVSEPDAEATVSEPDAEATVSVPELKETDVDEAGSVTLNGTGAPGATIEILEDGIVVGTALVQDDGSWTSTYKAASGEHTLAVQNQGEPASLSASLSLSVQVTTVEPGAGEETPASSEALPGQVYVVRRGDWLKKIAEQFWGDQELYILIVEATNAKAAEDATFSVIINPNFIYPGQKLWIPDR